MKKTKNMLIFFAVTVLFVACLSLSANATEWKTGYFDGDVVYFLEENTGTMIVKAKPGEEKAVIDEDFALREAYNLKDYYRPGKGLDSSWSEVNMEYPHVNKDILKTETLIVDDSIYSLGVFCFEQFTNVKTVILPENITEIPEGAFIDLAKLKTVVFSEELKTVGKGAFSGCKNLKTFDITSSVESIGEAAFFGCTALNISVPETVSNLGDYAFYGCDKDNVTVSSGVKNKGKNLFVAENIKVYSLINKTKNSVTVRFDFAYLEPVSKLEIYSYNPSDKSYKLCAEYKMSGKINYEGNSVEHIFKNLSADKTYTYAFRTSYTANGNTVKSGYEPFEVRINPDNIKSIKAKSTTYTITLTWSETAGANDYRIYQKVGNNWKLIGGTSETSYNVAKKLTLKPGTKYTFAVRGYTRVGEQNVASKKYISITTSTKTETPSVKVASTAKARATVAWTDVSGETGYQVYYSTAKSSGYKKISNYKAGTTKIYKTGLISNMTYYFRVRTYIKTDSGYVYSDFSPAKAVKIK